jgi:hypothetical protein
VPILPLAEDRVITTGYFDSMGVSLLRGRDFDAADTLAKPSVVIVNETLARQYFGREHYKLSDPSDELSSGPPITAT